MKLLTLTRIAILLLHLPLAVHGADRVETGSCQALLLEETPSELYIAEDFAPSEAYVGKISSSLYPEWAAKEANQVVTELVAGKKPKDILIEIAKSRLELEITLIKQGLGSLHPDRVGDFTEYRQALMLSPLGYSSATPIDWIRARSDAAQQRSLLSPTIRELIARVEKKGLPIEWPTNSIFDDEIPDRGRKYEYLKLDGSKIEDSGVVFLRRSRHDPNGVGFFRIQHPKRPATEELMADCWERLELARHASDDETSRIQLANAMVAFFRAMPFVRGSSATGRSFWSGVVKAILHKKVKLPSTIDLQAMVLEQQEFVDWIAAILK